MRKLKLILAVLLTVLFFEFTYAQDWANLNKYKNENTELIISKPNKHRVVFMGNSITKGWLNIHPEFFTNKPYVNRGIGGQTTPQMLLRFRQDVINLKPAVVVILAGINDIAENTGPSSLENIAGNITSMAELAKANNIKVILCSVLPAIDFPWRKGKEPAEKVVKLNELIKKYAKKNRIRFVDYYTAMVDESGGLKKDYGNDGVHPNLEGYLIMEPILEKVIAKTLSKKYTPNFLKTEK